MSESNYAGNYGAQRPNWTQQDFKSGAGMSDSQAAEAAAAAARARAAQSGKQGSQSSGGDPVCRIAPLFQGGIT